MFQVDLPVICAVRYRGSVLDSPTCLAGEGHVKARNTTLSGAGSNVETTHAEGKGIVEEEDLSREDWLPRDR